MECLSVVVVIIVQNAQYMNEIEGKNYEIKHMKSLFQLILDDCRRLVVIAVVGVVGRRRGFGFFSFVAVIFASENVQSSKCAMCVRCDFKTQ